MLHPFTLSTLLLASEPPKTPPELTRIGKDSPARGVILGVNG